MPRTLDYALMICYDACMLMITDSECDAMRSLLDTDALAFIRDALMNDTNSPTDIADDDIDMHPIALAAIDNFITRCMLIADDDDCTYASRELADDIINECCAATELCCIHYCDIAICADDDIAECADYR